MDAEWKPLRTSTRKAFPRVSIMQLACRLRSDEDAEEDAYAIEDRSAELEPAAEYLSDEPETLTLDTDPNEQPAGEPQTVPLTPGMDQNENPAENPTSILQTSNLRNEEYPDNPSYEAEILTLGLHRNEKFAENPSDETETLTLTLGVNQNEESAEKSKDGAQTLTLGVDHNELSAENTNDELQVLNLSLNRGQQSMELSLSRLKEKQEVIFLLDMMSLQARSFWEAMKRMLVSPCVLKLGFRFKQDLINLAKSFPEPDAHSCFDKVDPYVDIGKLYRELHGRDAMLLESLSLATICEQVVGYTLCKDLQCSDWEQRPLTVEQQLYAAADAHCLLVAYDVLETKASKGWETYRMVLPPYASGHELSFDCTATSGKGGIAELLLSDPVNLLNSHVSGNILHARHGIASVMVRSAVSGEMLLTSGLHTADTSSSVAAHMLISRKFGERLLVNAEGSNKLVRRKPKTHRGRNQDQVEAHSWSGPPPWHPLCGGDGSPKFLCDIMVEGLAKQLRNVGIDTVCPRVRKSDPRKMVELAEREGRVLLTQDVKLLRRRLIPRNLAYRVKSLGKQDQLAEVVKTFNLEILEENLLSRCTKCNGNFIPEPLTPEEAVASVPEGQTVPEYAITDRLLFWQCSKCMHMYWQGNQFHRALETFQAFARKVQTSQ